MISKKIISNKAQISLELALLLGAIVVAASVVGFYYLKSVKKGSITSKSVSKNMTVITKNKVLENIHKVKRVVNG